MTLSTGYTLIENAAEMTLRWMSPSLPVFFAVLAGAGLVGLPVVFVYRARVAPWAAKHLHWPLSPRAVGFLAPALSVLCGVALLFARPARPVVEWRFTREGVAVESLNGPARMTWAEVASARFDDRAPDADTAALVLKSADNREIWLILEWLVPSHRQKVLERVSAGLPRKVKIPPAKPAV